MPRSWNFLGVDHARLCRNSDLEESIQAENHANHETDLVDPTIGDRGDGAGDRDDKRR